MADQELKTWAEVLQTDPVTNIEQRRDITLEEFRDGWLRNMGVSAQQMNQILYLLSTSSLVSPAQASMWKNGVAIPDHALECNGQAITAVDYPNLFAYWGANLPDLTTLTVGFTYVVRKS